MRFGLKWQVLTAGVLLSVSACNSVPANPGTPVQLNQTQPSKATAVATSECTYPSDGSSSCNPTASTPPTSTPVPTILPTISPTAAPVLPSATAQPTACPPHICVYSSTLFLQRPIQPPGRDEIDQSYRFGSTQGGQRDPHHGVEFLNPYGTPVLAAADGIVVVAGPDIDPTSPRGVWPITFHGPYSNFYGNLVVIEHALPADLAARLAWPAGPLYTLYGHLSQIEVVVGNTVKAGQPIGKVGQAGIATGSHLHFEVRFGENSYKNARNPEAWLAQKTSANGQLTGAIAGSFIDSFGNWLEMPSIVLEHLPEGADGPSGFQVTVMTYEEKGLFGLPPWQDSFAVGDLPAGLYRISFPMGGLREELVQVFPGQLTVVTFNSR